MRADHRPAVSGRPQTTSPDLSARRAAARRRAAGSLSALVALFALTTPAAWADADLPSAGTNAAADTAEPTPSPSPTPSESPTPSPTPTPTPTPSPSPTVAPPSDPDPTTPPPAGSTNDDSDDSDSGDSPDDESDDQPAGDAPAPAEPGDPATEEPAPAPTTGAPVAFDKSGDLRLQPYIPSALRSAALLLEEQYYPIEAEFDWNVRPASLTVDFEDQSVCNGENICDQFEWDFGDGATLQGDSRFPTHEYKQPGTYDVTLTAWITPRLTAGCGGVDYDSYCTVTHKVTVLGPPSASFTAAPQSGPAPLTVAFKDTSTGEIDSRSWTFSGACSGAAATTKSTFSHVFTAVGNCVVTLTVTAPPPPVIEKIYFRGAQSAAFDPECNCSKASKTITVTNAPVVPHDDDDSDDSDDDSDDSDDSDNVTGAFVPPNQPPLTDPPSPEPTEPKPSPTTPTKPTTPEPPTEHVETTPAAWITGPGASSAGIALMILAAVIGSLRGLSMAGRRVALVADRDENTVQRHVAARDAEGWGDRSFTWRFPGHRLIDAASVVLPDRLFRFSPLVGRVAEDGSEFRAMFGSLWLATPLAGIALGLASAAASGGRAMPPSVWLLAASAVLATFDAFSGALAVVVFAAAALVGDAAGGPDFVHSLLVLLAIGFLWMAIPLIGSAIRPFRRLGDGSLRHRWDVVGDGLIAALLCGWVAQKLTQAMDLFAGQKTGLPEYANTIAIVVMVAVALRVAMEHFSMSAYPQRLQQVEGEDPPPPLLVSVVLGAFVRTAVFGFIGYAFIGSCWQLWLGIGLFLVPQLIDHLRERFRNFGFVQRILPRGIVEIFILVVACTLAARYAMDQSGDSLSGIRLAFLLIAIPPALLGALRVFAEDPDESGDTTWPREFLGAVIVAVTAVLAARGWDY